MSIQDELEAMTSKQYRDWENIHYRYTMFVRQWHEIAFRYMMTPTYEWMYELHKLQGLTE